jgi:hypothetical protein
MKVIGEVHVHVDHVSRLLVSLHYEPLSHYCDEPTQKLWWSEKNVRIKCREH